MITVVIRPLWSCFLYLMVKSLVPWGELPQQQMLHIYGPVTHKALTMQTLTCEF